MILNCLFHQTLKWYFSYIRNKEKKNRKIWPFKVYSDLKQADHTLSINFHAWLNKLIFNFTFWNVINCFQQDFDSLKQVQKKRPSSLNFGPICYPIKSLALINTWLAEEYGDSDKKLERDNACNFVYIHAMIIFKKALSLDLLGMISYQLL